MKQMKIMRISFINEDKHELRLFLRLINEISNNHQRASNLINKIEKILDQIQKDIKKYFTNSQIFELFKENLRILLFLVNCFKNYIS